AAVRAARQGGDGRDLRPARARPGAGAGRTREARPSRPAGGVRRPGALAGRGRRRGEPRAPAAHAGLHRAPGPRLLPRPARGHAGPPDRRRLPAPRLPRARVPVQVPEQPRPPGGARVRPRRPRRRAGARPRACRKRGQAVTEAIAAHPRPPVTVGGVMPRPLTLFEGEPPSFDGPEAKPWFDGKGRVVARSRTVGAHHWLAVAGIGAYRFPRVAPADMLPVVEGKPEPDVPLAELEDVYLRS